MEKIVLATNNFDKVKEIKQELHGLKIKILTLKDFKKIPKAREDGKTLEENAIKKAKQVFKRIGIMSLADDSGLEVEALGGKPGVYSSRFAGSGCTYNDNNLKLLKLLGDLPVSKRRARFKCVIAIVYSDGTIKTAAGVCNGSISFEAKGNAGFGYDPVFIPSGFKKTFAQLGLKTKNRISHRARAILKAKKILKTLTS